MRRVRCRSTLLKLLTRFLFLTKSAQVVLCSLGEDLRFANEMYDICSASKRAPARNLLYSRNFLYFVLKRLADTVASEENGRVLTSPRSDNAVFY